MDVLIVTALQEEYDAVLDVEEGAEESSGWDKGDPSLGETSFRWFEARGGSRLRVAVTLPAGMGGVLTAERAGALGSRLQPACLAMCGVCAGHRDRVGLGDVIVADMVWKYDFGKLIAKEEGGETIERFEPETRTHILRPDWLQAARSLGSRRATWLSSKPSWLSDRPAWSIAEQGNWMLERLFHGQDPVTRADRTARCPMYFEVVQALRGKGWLQQDDFALSPEGRQHIKNLLDGYPEGLPATPRPFAIHVGPIATGDQVVVDRNIFRRLRRVLRTVLGVEMEAFAIGAVAWQANIERMIVMKGVMDFADEEKNDHFKLFAARASAECLLHFLRNNLRPRSRRPDSDPSSPSEDSRPPPKLGSLPPKAGMIGRMAELLDLRRRFAEGARLVTITGIGGVGKSKLALNLQDGWVGTTTLITLATVGSPLDNAFEGPELASPVGRHIDEICTLVCRFLGEKVPEPNADAGGFGAKEFLVRAVGALLNMRGLHLLILDNAEHVAPDVAYVVEKWLQDAPDVRILVTSRGALTLPGSAESVLVLEPLALPADGAKGLDSDAARLFVDRANRAQTSQMDAINRIVRVLEGIPLAIEIAAGRNLEYPDLAAMEKELKQALFDVLELQAGSTTRSSTTRRQRALRMTIDWSWKLLPAQAKGALVSCAVFRGPFSRDAALKVIGGPGSVARQSIQALVQQAFLRVDTEDSRYSLFDVVRQFVQPIDEDGRKAALSRHATYHLAACREIVDRYERDRDTKVLAPVVDSQQDFEQAVITALDAHSDVEGVLYAVLALSWIDEAHGPHAGHILALDRALGAADSGAGVDPALRARVLAARGRARPFLGQHEESVADMRGALALAPESAPALRASILHDLGVILQRRRAPASEVHECYQKALQLYRDIGDKERVRQEKYALAVILHQVSALGGDIKAAREIYIDLLEEYEGLGDRNMQAKICMNLGILEQEKGDLDSAQKQVERALELSNASALPRRWNGLIRGALASVHHERGACKKSDAKRDYQTAMEGYDGALDVLHDVNDQRSMGITECRQAALRAVLGQTVEANEAFERGRALLRTLDPNMEVLADLASVFTSLKALQRDRKNAKHLNKIVAARAAARRPIVGLGIPLELWDDVRFLDRLLACGLTGLGIDPKFVNDGVSP